MKCRYCKYNLFKMKISDEILKCMKCNRIHIGSRAIGETAIDHALRDFAEYKEEHSCPICSVFECGGYCNKVL